MVVAHKVACQAVSECEAPPPVSFFHEFDAASKGKQRQEPGRRLQWHGEAIAEQRTEPIGRKLVVCWTLRTCSGGQTAGTRTDGRNLHCWVADLTTSDPRCARARGKMGGKMTEEMQKAKRER